LSLQLLLIMLLAHFIFQALQGFCVSVIMKHSSNITKLVLTCVSIMVNTLMSMALFDLQITLYFVISVSFILIGLPLYMLGSQDVGK